MPSLQARLVTFFLRRRFRPVGLQLASDYDNFPENIVRFRAKVERQAAKTPIANDITIAPWPAMPGKSEIVTAAAGHSDWALLYLHGGGFKFCSPQTHRGITSFFARNLPGTVFVPDYRLAPEHKFPAGLEDALAAYQAILSRGYRSDQIVVAGDSAGGGLTLALMLQLRALGVGLPAALGLMSPYADLTNSGLSTRLNSDSDAMFSRDVFERGEAYYHGEVDPRDPLVSPLFGDLNALPPMIIHASTSECLLDDATRIAAKVRRTGGEVELKLFDGLPHVWHLYCARVPEAARDTLRIALFLRARLQLPAFG